MPAHKHGESATSPILSPRSTGELLDMMLMLRRFEDSLIDEIMDLDEGMSRGAKEKRLSIAKGVRAGLEWALGMADKEIDQHIVGPEWEEWCRSYKSMSGGKKPL